MRTISRFRRATILTLALASFASRTPKAIGQVCGDLDGNGSVVATDALLVLNTAVGTPTVPPLICPADTCGDGVIDAEEECDQAELGAATCESQTLYGSGLECGADCTFDTSGCSETRYVDNGDGTVTDHQTGLQWEQKTDDDTVHDKDNTYTWSDSGAPPDGQAFVTLLGTLNACVEAPGFPPTDVQGGFAGHCDWRLPTIVEIQTLVDTTATGCGSGTACIDPIFGPTINYNYWSSTTFAENTDFAWYCDFDVGQVEEAGKSFAGHVRAVRRGD